MADAVSIITNGTSAAMQAYNANDEEMRKVITSKLMASVPLLVFDNIKVKLRGGALASYLTADVWSDRVLGSNQNVEVKVRTQNILTANNLEMEDEQVRRIVPIRLDARSDKPTEGRTFKHPALKTWMFENRAKLIWACLVIIQNWFAQGCQKADIQFASFEDYARVMGGILKAAGIDGFLSNLDAFRGAKKQDDDTETEFVQSLLTMLEGKQAIAHQGKKQAPAGFTAADVWAERRVDDDADGIDLSAIGIRAELGGNQSKRVSSKLNGLCMRVFSLNFRTWDRSGKFGGWKQDNKLNPILTKKKARLKVDGKTGGVARFCFEEV